MEELRREQKESRKKFKERIRELEGLVAELEHRGVVSWDARGELYAAIGNLENVFFNVAYRD